MSNDIVLRDATLSDAEVLAGFNRAMALETEGKQLDPATALAGARNLFDRPELGGYLVAECNGTIAGALLITNEWSDWRNGIYWWIQSVYVPVHFRRRGVYRALYAEVKRRAAERGDIVGTRLYVEQENRNAQATYMALGMQECRYTIFEELL